MLRELFSYYKQEDGSILVNLGQDYTGIYIWDVIPSDQKNGVVYAKKD